MKLLAIVFQEFLDERLGGSLHFRHGTVEKNLTMVQEKNMIGESFRQVSIVGNDDTCQFQLNFEVMTGSNRVTDITKASTPSFIAKSRIALVAGPKPLKTKSFARIRR